MRTVHQGMKRTDKVRKQGHLVCTDIRTCEVPAGLYSEIFEAQVESIPQAVFKSPADYVAMAMKANKCKLGHIDIY